MTSQQAYVKMHKWFSRPGAVLGQDRSFGGNDCVYRGNSKPYSRVRCAVGCLIPSRLYDPEMEGHSLDSCEVSNLLGLDNGSHDFAQQAQSLHDNSKTVERFLRELRSLARENNLTLVD